MARDAQAGLGVVAAAESGGLLLTDGMLLAEVQHDRLLEGLQVLQSPSLQE